MNLAIFIIETEDYSVSFWPKRVGGGLSRTLKTTERPAYSAYLSRQGTCPLSASIQHHLFYRGAVCFLQTSPDYKVINHYNFLLLQLLGVPFNTKEM